MRINSPVLVLNASYEPINICAARRAITMLVKGVAHVEETHEELIHRDIKLPSVIRLNNYRRMPTRRHVLSRRNILIRDRYLCQYCGQRFSNAGLTLDHIVPKSRGGTDTWENLVASCYECNHRKADNTPDEAGMLLLKTPRALTLSVHRQAVGADDPMWNKFLFK